MPMMAAYEYNDARDSARLLACRTLEGLQNLDRAPALENAINNMYRLLQGFRAHGFYGYVEQVGPDDDGGAFSAMRRPSDRNVGDLKHALEEAFRNAFAGQDPAKAIDDMKVILKTVAYPEDGSVVDPGEMQRTTRFFEILVHELEA